jgi:hypothetical protein
LIQATAALASGVMRQNTTQKDYIRFVDLDIDAADTATYCFSSSTSGIMSFIRCRFQRATSHGIYSCPAASFWGCEIDHNGGRGFSSANGITSRLFNCYIHDNASTGVYVDYAMIISHCLISTSGGDGIYISTTGDNSQIMNCTVRNSTQDGIEIDAAADGCILCSNVLYDNGGYGLNITTAQKTKLCDGNVAYSNTTDEYNLTLWGNTNLETDPVLDAASRLGTASSAYQSILSMDAGAKGPLMPTTGGLLAHGGMTGNMNG